MSKKVTPMAKLPGLYERSGVFQLRVVVPVDLRPQYGGRSKLIESLGTTDRATANRTGTARRALQLVEFDEKRKQAAPQSIDSISPELGKVLAQRIAARVMGADDILRSSAETARLLLASLRPARASKLRIGPLPSPAPPVPSSALFDPLEGIDAELAAELAEVNANMDAHSALQMTTQRIGDILPMVKAEARALGLEFDEKAPGALAALRECLRAYRRARVDIVKRDGGEPIETPPAPSRAEALQSAPSRLRDVLPQWIASKARKLATVKSAEKALALYEQATGNPPIASLSRAQGVDMRATLLSQGVTAKTARDRFDFIKGFLNFAALELELIPKNPWAGLAIEYTTENPRRPWSTEQMQALFSRPLHTEYAIPKAWNAGADAAYWMPLMALYSGARISELAQLRLVDIETVDGVPMLRITSEEPGMSVKTAAGHRSTPIHSELVRLGFLEFVEALRAAGAVRLFPALPLHATKPGTYFSGWFNADQRKASDWPKGLPVFHEFRHTVRSKLASAKVSEPMMNVLVGHEVGGSEGARTYTHRTSADLQAAIEALTFPGLELPRVYRAPAMVSARKRRAA